jgi:hypothetical protein
MRSPCSGIIPWPTIKNPTSSPGCQPFETTRGFGIVVNYPDHPDFPQFYTAVIPCTNVNGMLLYKFNKF